MSLNPNQASLPRAITVRVSRADMAARRGPLVPHYNLPLDYPRVYQWVVGAVDTIDGVTVIGHSGGAVGRWKVLDPIGPTWVKYTIASAQLSAAATTNDIELFSLPAGGVIHEVRTKHSVAFAGGAISAYTISSGITANLVKYASAFDVFQAVAGDTMQLSSGPHTENADSATSVRVAAVSTGANLDAATAGSVDVDVLWSVIS